MTGFERFCVWLMSLFPKSPPEDLELPPTPAPVVQPPDVAPLTPKPAPMPTQPPAAPAPVQTPLSLLTKMADAIKQYEGFILPGGKDSNGVVYPTGSFSYKFNNPGNLVFAGQAGAKPMVVQTSNGPHTFACFPTYEQGYQALENQIESVAKGTSPTYKHEALAKYGLPSSAMLTLAQYFGIYSPSSDGNAPSKYAAWVAARMGVDPNVFTMQHLLLA